jgi:hypothetical protein
MTEARARPVGVPSTTPGPPCGFEGPLTSLARVTTRYSAWGEHTRGGRTKNATRKRSNYVPVRELRSGAFCGPGLWGRLQVMGMGVSRATHDSIEHSHCKLSIRYPVTAMPHTHLVHRSLEVTSHAPWDLTRTPCAPHVHPTYTAAYTGDLHAALIPPPR